MGTFRLAAVAVRSLAGFLALVALPSLTVRAADLPRPAGQVILTVTGAISVTNALGKAEFDQAMLAALGVDHLKTSTSWTDGPQDFEGVTAAKLLDAIGARGTTRPQPRSTTMRKTFRSASSGNIRFSLPGA